MTGNYSVWWIRMDNAHHAAKRKREERSLRTAKKSSFSFFSSLFSFFCFHSSEQTTNDWNGHYSRLCDAHSIRLIPMWKTNGFCMSLIRQFTQYLGSMSRTRTRIECAGYGNFQIHFSNEKVSNGIKISVFLFDAWEMAKPMHSIALFH